MVAVRRGRWTSRCVSFQYVVIAHPKHHQAVILSVDRAFGAQGDQHLRSRVQTIRFFQPKPAAIFKSMGAGNRRRRQRQDWNQVRNILTVHHEITLLQRADGAQLAQDVKNRPITLLASRIQSINL